MAVDLGVFDLKVGNRGLEMRIPVHEAFAAIDQALLVHIDEDLDHGIMEIGAVLMARARVALRARHGEGVAVPVAGASQALQLLDDGAAIFALPFPDLFKEFLAAHLAAAFIAFRRQHLLDLQLRRDARMVLPRLPQRVEAAHPVPAHEDVLQRVVEGVPHMQRAGHVGRRDHDGEGLGPRGIRPRRKGPCLVPFRRDPRFGLGRVKALFHRPHILFPLSDVT